MELWLNAAKYGGEVLAIVVLGYLLTLYIKDKQRPKEDDISKQDLLKVIERNTEAFAQNTEVTRQVLDFVREVREDQKEIRLDVAKIAASGERR